MSVFDRLSSPVSYTGVYAERFRSGPHINGQTDAYLPGESTAFRGHTNEPIPRVVHDVSEILRPNLNRDRDAPGAPTARAAERARAKLAAAERAVLEQAGLAPPPPADGPGGSVAGSPRDGSGSPRELDTNTHLRLLFDYYARYGRTGADAVDTGSDGSGSGAVGTMDSANFAKLCRECPDLLDGQRVDGPEVDLAFIRAKAAVAAAAASAAGTSGAAGHPHHQHAYPSAVRRLTYHGFLDALLSLATAKYPELDAATAFSLLLSQHVFRAPPSAGIVAAFRDGLITVDDGGGGGVGAGSSVAGGGSSVVSPPAARRRRPSGSVAGGSVAGHGSSPAVVLSPTVQARLASAGRPPARAPRRATLAGSSSSGSASSADDPLAPPPRPFSAEELAESLSAVPAAAFLTAASARDAIRRLPPDVIAALYSSSAGAGAVPSAAAASVGGATSAANGHGFNDGSVVAGGTPGPSSVDTRTGGLGPFGGGTPAALGTAASNNRSGRSALLPLSFSPGSAAESSVVGDRLLQCGLNVSADSSGGDGGGGGGGSDGGAGDAMPPFDVSAPHTERTDRGRDGDDDRDDGIARAAAARKISNAEPPSWVRQQPQQQQQQQQQQQRHVLPAHLEAFVRSTRVAAGVAPPAAAAISPRSVIGGGGGASGGAAAAALLGASPRTQRTQRTSPSRVSQGGSGSSVAAAVVARDAVVAATPPASVYEAIARKTLQLQHGGGGGVDAEAAAGGLDYRRGSDSSSFGHVGGGVGGGVGPSRLDASFASLSIHGAGSSVVGRSAAVAAAAATPTRHSLATDPSRPQTLSSSAQYYAAVAPGSAARHAPAYGAVAAAAAAAAATRHDLDASADGSGGSVAGGSVIGGGGGGGGGGRGVHPSTPGAPQQSAAAAAASSARRTPNAAFFRTAGASLGSPSAAGDGGGDDGRSAAGSGSVAGPRAPSSVIYSPHAAFDETPVGPGASAARFYFTSRGSPTGGSGSGSPGDASRRAPSPSGSHAQRHHAIDGAGATVLLRPGAAGAAAFSGSLRAGLYDAAGTAVYSPAAARHHGRVAPSTPGASGGGGGGKPGYGEPGFTPTLAGSGNRRGGVYERLSSPGSFTGVYRRAFESGDGRINGHASTLSAVPHGFRGSTHDKSDVPIGDISAVLRPNLRSALRR